MSLVSVRSEYKVRETQDKQTQTQNLVGMILSCVIVGAGISGLAAYFLAPAMNSVDLTNNGVLGAVAAYSSCGGAAGILVGTLSHVIFNGSLEDLKDEE